MDILALVRSTDGRTIGYLAADDPICRTMQDAGFILWPTDPA